MRRGRMRDCLFSLLGVGILVMANPVRNAAGAPPGRGTNPAVKKRSNQSFQSLGDILQYISDDWTNLRRSLTDCGTYEDTKIEGEPALYLPADAEEPAGLEQSLKPCDVRVFRLPAKISEEQAGQILPHGLLYLPQSLRGAGRAVQRDVRLGQLLHHSRAASR